MRLKIMENIEDIRFVLKAKQPRKFDVIIYEAYIVAETS